MYKGVIELIKKESDNKEVITFQIIRDNTHEITGLLSELNIIDDFNEEMKEKIIELAMALSSHDGKLDIK
jgi:HEPN domain-containing protein